MQDQDENGKGKTQKASTTPSPHIRLESSGEVVVTHQPVPPKGPPEKQIHPRRPLPLVPDARTEEKSDKEHPSEVSSPD